MDGARLLALFGGLIGAGIGIPPGKRLASRKRAMDLGFAALVILIGVYVMICGIA